MGGGGDKCRRSVHPANDNCALQMDSFCQGQRGCKSSTHKKIIKINKSINFSDDIVVKAESDTSRPKEKGAFFLTDQLRLFLSHFEVAVF